MAAHRAPTALVLVLLALFVGSTTAVGLTYVKYLEQTRVVEQMRQRHLQADRELRELTETIDFLRERLGYARPTGLAALRQSVLEDLEPFGEQVVGEDYRSVLDYLVRTIAQERSDATSLAELNEKLRAELISTEPKYASRVEIHRKFQEETAAELLRVQDESVANLSVLENQITFMLDRIETTTGKLQEAYRLRDQDRDQATRKIQKLLSAVRSLRAEKQRNVDPTRDPPDGKVVYVDSASRSVSLSIGAEDGVRRGMTFRVFRPDSVGRPGKAIATLEVTKLKGSRSTAAIRQNNLLKPILTGDLVYSPVLRHRGTESFALAGKLDIDGDGKDDALRLRRFIERQGGRIDLYIDPQGAIEGKMTLSTKYVVMDDKSEQGDKEYLELLSRLHTEAIDHGIPVISARRFADEIGFFTPTAGR